MSESNGMLSEVSKIRGRMLKENNGRTISRDALTSQVVAELDISNAEARCLLGAVYADDYGTGPNFSAKAAPDEWMMLYKLIRSGYEKNAWGVVRKALKEAVDKIKEA